MNTLTATFVLPQAIAEGLMNGNYERVGGVVRDAITKQVVLWLREVCENGGSPGSNSSGFIDPGTILKLLSVNPAMGVANLAVSAINTGVSVHGFSKVNGSSQSVQTVQDAESLSSEDVLPEFVLDLKPIFTVI